MNFGASDTTARQFDESCAFEFAPPSAPENGIESCQISNTAIYRDNFYIFNGADERKINLTFTQEN